VGEFIALKSRITQRQIQTRFTRLDGRDELSVMTGIVIQDEGNTPKVQFTIPTLPNEGVSTPMTDGLCKIQMFVDGVQRDVYEGSGTDAVSITVGKYIVIKYKVSGMKVKLGVVKSTETTCRLNSCYHIPDGDDTLAGLLGSPDGDASNDWMTPDGTTVQVEGGLIDRSRQGAYDYCSANWCMTEPEQSLFLYNEHGVGFDDFSRCELPYGTTLAEFVEEVDESILAFCDKDVGCMMDAMEEGIEAVREARNTRLELSATCNKENGECKIAPCCDGYSCIDMGLAGSICSAEALTCMVRGSGRGVLANAVDSAN
jgi:hypothetical protein